MATYKLLTTLALVAGFFGASAEVFDNIENYEPIDLSLPFMPWKNEDSAWEGSLASPHIVGGSEAVPHSHPHQALLVIKGEDINGVQKGGFCGGSLIADSWIVTAAHCADKAVIFQDLNPNNADKYRLKIFAALGAHNSQELYSAGVQVLNVSDIIIHPYWSMFAIKNDIALLKLVNNALIDGETVKPIRLPKLSQQSESFRGSTVTMTGWGMVNTKDKKLAKMLQTLDSTVVSNLYCKLRYLFLLVQDTNICVSAAGGKSTCKGDSGGPMIIKEAGGEPTLIGITSFGLGCTWGFPGAFTRVTSYLEWIHNITGVPIRN